MTAAIISNRNGEIHKIGPTDNPDFLNKIEETQSKIVPYIPSDSLRDINYLRNAQLDQTDGEVIKQVDEIRQHLGQKSLSRLIFELCARVSAVADAHVLRRRNQDRQRKDKIDAKVQEQKECKIKQAKTQGIGGSMMGILGFAGAMIGGPVGDVCKQLSALPRPAMDMVLAHYDGKMLPIQHETSYYLNTVQSAKQAIESIKNLVDQKIQPHILELMRMEVRAIESMSQR